jgi:hypothetical protein
VYGRRPAEIALRDRLKAAGLSVYEPQTTLLFCPQWKRWGDHTQRDAAQAFETPALQKQTPGRPFGFRHKPASRAYSMAHRLV